MNPEYSDYNWHQSLTIHPIGFVISDLKTPSLAASKEGIRGNKSPSEMHQQTGEIKTMTSQIVINPALEGILDGLADFSHALILYWPHLISDESRSIIKVHPMGCKDIDKVGVFASCSPARPNPVLVTAVEVQAVKDNTLTVKGLEAVDGSPVIDIKPYNRHYLEVTNLQPAAWMERTTS